MMYQDLHNQSITLSGSMLGLFYDAEYYAIHTTADSWLISSWVLEFHSHSSYKIRQTYRKKVVEIVERTREEARENSDL